MKTLLVTGATSGLGLEVVKAAHKRYRIIANGRKTEELQRLKRYYKCHVVQGDLNNTAVQNCIASEARELEATTAILCAGVYQGGYLHTLSEGGVIGTITTNLTSQILLIAKLLLHMPSPTTIAVVNSLAGKSGNVNEPVYCASKFGLRGFVESLRYEHGKVGTRIFGVYPGAMRTPMTKHRADWDKLLNPASVAKLIVDICEHDDMRIDNVEIMRTTY
jgi:NAD(P)-dependent dehydrogenase (short-subunit alcohol dehydrogenase family)